MPTNVNLVGQFSGLNSNARSLRVWTYPEPWPYPPTPAAMPATPAEVPFDQAHYVVMEGFPQTNQRGTTLGRASIDTGSATVQEYYGTADLEAILANAFGSGN